MMMQRYNFLPSWCCSQRDRQIKKWVDASNKTMATLSSEFRDLKDGGSNRVKNWWEPSREEGQCVQRS